MRETFITRSPGETWQLAATLLPRLAGGAVVALHGDLGAGKTTLIQGLAFAMGVTTPVTSPTFALLAEHQGASQRLIHLDLYRLASSDELLDIGFLDYLASPNIVVVEWPERAADVIPTNALHLFLEPGDESETRRITVVQH